jgi:hypothetical protein
LRSSSGPRKVPLPSPRFVANKESLVELFALADAFHSTPAALLGVEDSWLGYQLNLVTLIAGRQEEGKASDNAKPAPSSSAPSTGSNGQSQQFRDPSRLAVRKVKVRPDGTWD